MIDLSFLTEEEQEAIMKVLQRDAALKRAEEERVRHLPEKVKDDQQLKNMSGQWFYEAKAKRHRDRIHGADIIRASMRKKRPQVADEQSKDRANRAKESWVNNVHKDAFLPPELTGVVEEPEEDVAPASPSSSVVNPASTMIDASQENTRKSAISPAKPRKNPFNSSMLPEDHLSQQTKNEQSKNGKTGLFQTSKEGELSESKEESSILDISSQKLEKPKQTLPGPESGFPIKAPVPKPRKMIYKSQDLKQDDNQPFPRQRTDSLTTRGAPRGILKRNSSSSSTDSETVRFHQNFEPKSKIVSLGLTIHERISEKEHSLEDDSPSNSLEPLKHVRFSAVKDELPQSSGLVHGREVGEFSVLESDRLKNGTEDAGLTDEVWNDPQPSQYTNGLPFQSSASSPSPSKNETSQPTTSGSFPINEHPSSKEFLTTRAQSTENSHTINEHKTSSSELSKNPAEEHFYVADELSCTEPELSQVPDCSSRDHQQGKPPLLQALRAKTSSHSGPYATEIRKTTDDSISKVLDWFNRSSYSDDSVASLQYPQDIEPKEKPDSKPQIAVALVTEDASQEGNGLIALLPTKVELTPVGPDSTFQVEEHTLPSGNCQDNNVHIKPRSINLFPQGKESLGMLQPFEIYSPNQESKTKDYSQGSKNIGKAVGVLIPANKCSYSVHKGPHAEDQVLCNIKDAGSLGEEEPQLRVYEKNIRKSEVNFDSSTIIQEPSLKAHAKAESESKGRDTSILKSSLEPENIESPPGAASGVSPWKKLEVQVPEAGEVPQNRVQREKYKRVSDRISFWESTKAAIHKEPPPPFSQERPSAKARQPVMSMDSLPMSRGKCNTQVTTKQVILDNDGQAAHVSGFYSSKKPKETRPQISGPSKNDPSADQSGTVSLFQNKTTEPVKRLPVTDSLHSEKDITFPPLHHPSNVGIEMHTSLEKDRSLIGERNPNFKVMSLQERINEPNTEQVYNHSQFENLRRFWDLGANPNCQDNIEKNTTTISQKNSVLFNSQKHKEFSDVTSSGNSTHEREMLLDQKEIPAREEIEKLNSKGTLQVLPDDTTFPWRPPRKSTHQLPRYESSKENMGKNTECFVTPMFKGENDDSDQELEEIQESIVKTSVSSKDYKDTLNDSLQKLLFEASSPVLQPSGGNVQEKQVFEPDVSENRTWPQETDFAAPEEEAKRPKEISNEHIDKTVAPPKAYLNTLTASLDKLLKEATGSPPSPLQTKCEPTTTGISSESEESSVDENRIEQSQNTSADEREKMASFPEGTETWGNSSLSQEAQSGSEEEPSPVLKILERSAARKMPSKSLEDISSDSSNQAKVDNLPEELVRSAEDDQKADQEPDTNECIPGISTVSSQPDNQFSHPDKLKRMSKSVPAFLQDESDDRETDTASEGSYQLSRHKKSPSSLTNLSSNSGMTSLSSVSGSVMSVYSGDFGNLEVKGSIQFAIDYVDSLKELHVFVAQCKDLAAADIKKQRSDPYVKTYLLPDKGKMGKKKTLVVKKTLNPVYNEILRYKINKQILKTQKLNLSVWHRDTFKRNSFLGEVELDLETWDWDNKQNKQLKWYPLKRKTAPVPLEAENRGEMKLALQYVPEPVPGKKLPTTGEVHIWVKECLDLPLLRGSHLNSFVKCTILPDTSRKSRQKTRAVGKTTNPVFNHTMVYDGFRPEDLTEACVELTVWDHYKLTNQFLGGLRIGFGTGKSYGTEVDWMDSTSEEVALWEKMVKSPNTWIEAILPLRMLLIAKISK
ncbi:synaptotagmin-like protein 2 isoform X1 [Bos taurus]|uniref:synaptotagmin-like protein 2 isoform X1 n=1 Tax=Bos taurus TaxID=9913 RepID=UPI0028CB4FFA|nr:synaptotagmin-like protein 2 isoform X1 [Bos taurus]XP_059739007.1 synaptotagmin-like protein 2 isoform X1 [Bos taurus]XP_059739008.1 synaptotagmin-like protein 2 isoform X1 [Bos taurus]